jgi:hypothetical protein
MSKLGNHHHNLHLQLAFKVKYICLCQVYEHNGRCGHFCMERHFFISAYQLDFNFLVRRYKQIAATRLAIAGLNVAYGIKVSISRQYTPVCLSVLSVCPVRLSSYLSTPLSN